MGKEAVCRARYDGKLARGKALLETNDLIFRGAQRDELRVTVPFKEMTSVSADASNLTVVWRGGELVLELPAGEAPKWAERIRHPPSLLDKLGVKPTSTVALVGGASAFNDAELRAFVTEVEARATRMLTGTPTDAEAGLVMFMVVHTRADLPRIAGLIPSLRAGGALWILRPKGSTAVTESDVRGAGRAAGLTDVKVAAFSPARTADKFVVPVAARGRG